MSEGAGRNDDRIGGGKKRATRRARERGVWILEKKKKSPPSKHKHPARLLPRAPPRASPGTPAPRAARGALHARASRRVAPRSMSSPRTPPASAGKRSRVARRASSRGAGKGSDAPTRAARTPARARPPGTHPEADAAFAERAVHLFALELEGHVLAMVEASRARQSLDAAMRVRPRATLFKTPLQLPLKIREEILYGKIPPGPRASAHAPSLPSSRRTSASSRTPRATRSTPPPPPRASRRTPPRRRGAAAPSRAARPRRCGNGETRSPPPTPRERASPSPPPDAAPSATRSTRQTLAAPRTTTETTPGTPSDAPCERKAKRRAERRFREARERERRRTTAATAPGRRDLRTRPRAPRGRLPRRRPRRSAR